jgi:hypothetical protein
MVHQLRPRWIGLHRDAGQEGGRGDFVRAVVRCWTRRMRGRKTGSARQKRRILASISASGIQSANSSPRLRRHPPSRAARARSCRCGVRRCALLPFALLLRLQLRLCFPLRPPHRLRLVPPSSSAQRPSTHQTSPVHTPPGRTPSPLRVAPARGAHGPTARARPSRSC